MKAEDKEREKPKERKRGGLREKQLRQQDCLPIVLLT